MIELASAAPSRLVPNGNAHRFVCSGNIQFIRRPVITVFSAPKQEILEHGSTTIGEVATNVLNVPQSKSPLGSPVSLMLSAFEGRIQP
jgi:hypothetical protein